MKNKVAITLLVLIVTMSLPTATWPEDDTTSGNIIGVREMMKNIDKYSGTINVEGVVSNVFSEQKMIGLIDIQEVEECKVITCASLTLPVMWKGPMPDLKDQVIISGEVQKQQGGLIFVAEKLKKIDQNNSNVN